MFWKELWNYLADSRLPCTLTLGIAYHIVKGVSSESLRDGDSGSFTLGGGSILVDKVWSVQYTIIGAGYM